MQWQWFAVENLQEREPRRPRGNTLGADSAKVIGVSQVKREKLFG